MTTATSGVDNYSLSTSADPILRNSGGSASGGGGGGTITEQPRASTAANYTNSNQRPNDENSEKDLCCNSCVENCVHGCCECCTECSQSPAFPFCCLICCISDSS